MLKVPPRWEPLVRRIGEGSVYAAFGFLTATLLLAAGAMLTGFVWELSQWTSPLVSP